MQLRENLTYEEQPIEVLDRREQVLRHKVIPLVKVLWRNHGIEEATWEHEHQMCTQYPQLFEPCMQFKFRGRNFLRGEEIVNPPP